MTDAEIRPVCPLPLLDHDTVQMAHGGGGRLMHDLIDRVFCEAFGPDRAERVMHDAQRLDMPGTRLAFSTDSYVVNPLFFPGGDIGALAVNGTVNDVAMAGARPLVLSAGFILEEGLPMETLWSVVQSMRRAAEAAGVRVVTGDTKVVDSGKADGLYINTAGIGVIEHEQTVGPEQIAEGDAVLLSGDVGRHGAAIMSVREGLAVSEPIESDCAPLSPAVAALLASGVRVHCLRDLTRGGLAGALAEIAEASGLHIHVSATAIPVQENVRGLCELLGLDPVHVANEGRMVIILPEADMPAALTCLQAHAVSRNAVRIGSVDRSRPGRVTIESEIGTSRYLDMLSGEQLPRIC